MLPIGDRFVMSPREAARAVTLLQGVEAVIPMHYGTFPLLTGTPAAFHEALEGVESHVDVIEMRPGEGGIGTVVDVRVPLVINEHNER